MMSKKIQGVLTAIVTPFDNDGAYAEAAMRRQIQRQLLPVTVFFAAAPTVSSSY